MSFGTDCKPLLVVTERVDYRLLSVTAGVSVHIVLGAGHWEVGVKVTELNVKLSPNLLAHGEACAWDQLELLIFISLTLELNLIIARTHL